MNACIFAYGQTGSGKTHTMIGDAKGGEMAGVSYRTMNKLFQVLELRRRQQVKNGRIFFHDGTSLLHAYARAPLIVTLSPSRSL